MAHRERFMQEVAPGVWVIECRICWGGDNRGKFATARACHDWWRAHVESAIHAECTGPERTAARLKRHHWGDPEHQLLFAIFGNHE